MGNIGPARQRFEVLPASAFDVEDVERWRPERLDPERRDSERRQPARPEADRPLTPSVEDEHATSS